jgi:hypothetical protein
VDSVYDFSIFKNSSFGETVVYTPSGGAAVSIKACVFRRGLQKLDPRNSAPIPYYPVVVEVDTVDVPTVTVNEDKISCPDATGVTREFRVSKILYSDEGCFKLGMGA